MEEKPTKPETDVAADTDAYYGEDDAAMDDIDLSFLDDEDADEDEQEKHAA